MDTAPTTTTAEAGVFAIYRYDSAGSQSNDIRKLAACYYLAHIISSKNMGEFPDYSQTASIAPYLRKDLGGGDWLGLCYETLGLQDKLFLIKSDGEGLPLMEGF